MIRALTLSALALTAPFAAGSAPPIPDDNALRAQIAAMMSVDNAIEPTLSPDGKQVAFLSSMSGEMALWVVASESGWPRKITAFEDSINAVIWSPRGDWLLVSVAPGGGMNNHIHLVRPDGSESRKIVGDDETINFMGLWIDGGNAFTFASNQRNRVALDAYIYSLDTQSATRHTEEEYGISAVVDITDDGRTALVMTSREQYNAYFWLLDLESGERTQITRHEQPGSYRGAGLLGNGRVVVPTNQSRELTALAGIRLKDGKPVEASLIAAREDADLEQVEVSEDGSRAALLWNRRGVSEIELLNLGSLERAPIKLPAEVAAHLSISADGNRVAFASSGAAAPADVWVYDDAQGTLHQSTFSPHPQVVLETLVEPVSVSYAAHDGLDLSAWLYLPHASRQRKAPGPFALMMHGGPSVQERTGFRADYQALLAQGIGILAPNIRGSAGFGRKFRDADNGAARIDAIRDIATSVAYLVEEGHADPRRIGIAGQSYGGYLTNAAVSFFPELFGAGVCYFGLVDFETYFSHQVPWKARLLVTEYGDPATELDMLKSLSPIHRFDQVTAPMLIMHGQNDNGVPVIEARKSAEALAANGVEHELVIYEDEGHGFTHRATQVDSTLRMVNWFKRHLGP
ncbi:MAG: S9 family peptidase [Gammaproteobacteria bacterium]|nr:S9 family peptidase [Gammaproteobacteria bacterium]